MDLNKVKAYLKENGFEKGKLAHLTQLLEEAVSSELAYRSCKGFRAERETKEKLQDVIIEKEKLEAQVAILEDKLKTPSESFKAQFIECAKEYISLEEYDSSDYGDPYRSSYKLVIGE